MALLKMRELGPGYTSEVDTVDELQWCQLLQGFDDANIYQTWTYAAVISGQRKTSRLILKSNGDVVAVAQARIAKLPLLNVGIAYVLWGPLWRRGAAETHANTFRQAVRALRNEFACKRGLVLRLFPNLFDNDSQCFSTILAEEGFSSLEHDSHKRTILMDLSPSLQELREGMGGHWKRSLKVAERKGLEIVEGSGDELFGSFIQIHQEMVSRKKFVEPNDINQFRSIQAQLPDNLKMKIILCRSSEGICAGLICSAIGETAIYLFGATSNAGLHSCGSYLLHWKLIEKLKQDRFATYDLGGINPTRNPGTHKFKKDLSGRNGKDVYYLGRFDSHTGLPSYVCVECGDALRATYRTVKALFHTARSLKLWPNTAGSPRASQDPHLTAVKTSR